jgi:tetratricopeptide (TPR) repeat protein
MASGVNEPAVSGGEARRGVLLGLAAVVLVCLLVYGRTVRMGFVYDDIPLLQERSLIWSPNVLGAAFGSAGMGAVGKATPYYRPLLTLSLAVDHRLWGTNPAGFHGTNVVLHCLAAALVFLVARRLFRSLTGAVASGLLCALHPVQAEAVTWVTARGDIICACFMLAAFLAYLGYAEKGSMGSLGASLLLFFGALLTKEMAITFPVLVLLHALVVQGERGGRLPRLGLYLVPIGLYLGLRLAFLKAQVWGGEPLAVRLYTGVGLVARYLANVLVPFDLRVFYDLPVQRSLASGAVLVPAALTLAALVATLLALRFRRPIGFGLAWFFVTLLPVSGLLTLLQPALMADRYLYVPMAGCALAFGGALAELGRRSQRTAVGMGGTLLVLLGVASFVRSADWRDQSAFVRGVVRDAPESAYGRYFAGQMFLEQGRLDEAMTAFTRTIERDSGLYEAYMSRGLVFLQEGLLPEAAEEFTAALRVDPGAWKVYTNLGFVYAQQGRTEEAAAAFRRALALNPGDTLARENLERLSARPPAAGH